MWIIIKDRAPFYIYIKYQFFFRCWKWGRHNIWIMNNSSVSDPFHFHPDPRIRSMNIGSGPDLKSRKYQKINTGQKYNTSKKCLFIFKRFDLLEISIDFIVNFPWFWLIFATRIRQAKMKRIHKDPYSRSETPINSHNELWQFIKY